MRGDTPRHADHDLPERYPHASRRPLAIAAFLLPAVVFFEIAAVTVLGEGTGSSTLTSRNLIHTLFEVFGVIGVHLPAVLLLATLAAHHLIARDPLRLSPRVPLYMGGESLVWALPLLVFAGVLGFLHSLPDPEPRAAIQLAAIAVGAGVYEEFVFRFVLIASVHALLVDLCGVKDTVGRWIGVAVSVFAFASYHGIATDGAIDPSAAAFYGIAGLFLSWLFLTRGLGIAAGAHAVYDLLVLVALPALMGS